MRAVIARATLVGVFALGGSSAVQANGDCGINSNKPCPPGKSSAKEPAYKTLNSNKPTAQRADDPPVQTNVLASESAKTSAKATLSGISASDLKKPSRDDCGINSNKPCADQEQGSTPARVKATDGEEKAAKGLSGVNPDDLKIKPKPTGTFEKEPATKP